MKRIKKRIWEVLLVSISVAELMGCAPKQQKYEEQAVQVLQKKYDEEFEIIKYQGRQSMDDHYGVIAFSKKYPDILFEADVACDGSYIMDEYIASRVCRTIEEKMKSNMGGLQGYIQIKVQAISKSIDSDKSDMSAQEFMLTKPQNRFVVYISCCLVENDIEDLYQKLSNAFSGLEGMNGSIKLYMTNEKILKQVQEYLSENAKVDYEFDEALEHTKPVTILFVNGKMELSKEEFVKKVGEAM